MKVTAKLNNLRIAPRKVRLVADLVRGMEVNLAKAQLHFLAKRSAEPILKLLNSAVANAEDNFSMDKNNLKIVKLTVDGGAVLKRWLPRSMGRATPLLKRTSHVTMVLDEIVEGKRITKEKNKKSESEMQESAKTDLPKKLSDKGMPKAETKKVPAKSSLKSVGKIFRRKSI